ncbi:MAG: hypothetical protein JNK56_22795, partial [Myxococcales bacterium]|nr:hypothetical protein [Myxococcales bacterium]
MTTTRSAFTARSDSRQAADDLLAALADARPRVLVFFAALDHDGALLGDALAARFPGACVLGCS